MKSHIDFLMDKLMDRVMEYWLEVPEANCAISTACPILEYYGYLDESTVMRQAFRVYGGGLSWRLACGTITGNVAALGFIGSDKGLPKGKIELIVKEFMSKMEEKFGDLNCRNLMKDWTVDGAVNFDLPGRQDRCTNLVQESVHLSIELIEKYMS